MTPVQFLKRAVPQILLSTSLAFGGALIAAPAGAQVSDGYYDDDPGDPEFEFQTPFEEEPVVEVEAEAEVEAEEDPAAEAAGDPALPAPVAQDPPVVAADVVTPEVAPAAAPATEPAVLEALPRTGSGVEGATLVGGLLLIGGGIASLLGRRRKGASQA